MTTPPPPLLPVEIVQLILSWIDPLTVLELRHLSRSFNECICSVSFAKLNIGRFLTDDSSSFSFKLKLAMRDILLFRGPLSHQTAMAKLIKASTLKLTGSPLSAQIPSTVKYINQLVYLDLGYCRLRGLIPCELTTLSQLQSVRLCGNELEGPIPDTIGNWKLLQTLNLASNRLSGSIPSSIGCLKELKHLILSENELSGPIPVEMENLVKLQDLFLGKNQLCGLIPPQVASLKALSWVSLSQNQFSGVIPNEFGDLENLQYLRLSGNYGLSGPISEGVLRLVHARQCDIAEDLIMWEKLTEL
ncbi:hypothetical protein HDU79_002687 [Rhizoclosmatium sp. JEL0117]|nr:hypothetical protein HDU79_002687 [Rhizoclosmatium sp. JEL0117]